MNTEPTPPFSTKLEAMIVKKNFSLEDFQKANREKRRNRISISTYLLGRLFENWDHEYCLCKARGVSIFKSAGMWILFLTIFPLAAPFIFVERGMKLLTKLWYGENDDE